MDIKVDNNSVGVALLVSNDYTSPLSTQKGLRFTHTDTDNLAQLFKEFTYAVYRKKNVSVEEFVSCYKALAEFKYPPTCKRILVYFSGHGEDGVLLMQDDGKVNIEDMISCFKVHVANNSRLAKVVKMFFIDACRGLQRDDGYRMKAKANDEITCLKRVPKEGNTLVAYASTRYHVSVGDATGSRWTNCLVKALRESKESDDVCNVLTDANIAMRKEPYQHCFQTAEFTSSLVDRVHFKQEGIKMRNILVIGSTGSGKSLLINNVIGEDCLHIHPGFLTAPTTRAQHVCRELLINDNKYQCSFTKLVLHAFDKPPHLLPHPYQRECLERLNLIIYVMKLGRLILEEKECFKIFTQFFPQSISALVFTYSEFCDNARRNKIVEEFKSHELTKDIAAKMGKGIYTVGFPDLADIPDPCVEIYKLKIQEDVSKLHRLIEESNNSVHVDVLKTVARCNDILVYGYRCSII